MRSPTEKVTYQHEETNYIVDADTGEVKQAQKTTHKVSRLETEPPYVKLYLDCLSKFKGMQVSFNPILNEFLKRATYADPDDETGGQVIYCTKIMKEIIAKKCEVSFKRVEQAITEFVKKGIFSRIGVGTYQVNPYLFGKGEWKDIRKIRATFDFNTGEAIADIVKDEEAEMTATTEVLEKQYQQKIKKLASQDPVEDKDYSEYLQLVAESQMETQATLFDVTNACVDTQAVNAVEA